MIHHCSLSASHTPLNEEVTEAAGEVGEAVWRGCAAHIGNVRLQRRPAGVRNDSFSSTLKDIIYINAQPKQRQK